MPFPDLSGKLGLLRAPHLKTPRHRCLHACMLACLQLPLVWVVLSTCLTAYLPSPAAPLASATLASGAVTVAAPSESGSDNALSVTDVDVPLRTAGGQIAVPVGLFQPTSPPLAGRQTCTHACKHNSSSSNGRQG